MALTRRDLLKYLGYTAATLSSLEAMAQALMTNDMNFVLIRVPGAMDSTLGLHPWIDADPKLDKKDLFLGYDLVKDVLRVPNTSITLGPSAHAMQPFANRMAIVRGIYMGSNDLGHPFAIQHISSGRTQESAPHWSAYIGSQYSGNGKFVVTNSSIQRGVLNPFPIIPTQVLKQLGNNFEGGSLASSASIYKNSQLGINRYTELLKQTTKVAKFKETLAKFPNRKNELDTDQAVAVAALVSGLTQVVQLDLNFQNASLDTHGGHEQAHKTNQKLRWDLIAKFLKEIESNGLMDKTLVAVVTEFNRSPGFNDNDGKDHNYSDNAMALIGRNVNGGRVFGDRKLYVRSQNNPYALWAGSFIDFNTGATQELDSVKSQIKENVAHLPSHIDLVRPADVWSSVAASLGKEINKFAPQDGKIIQGLFKT